MVIKYAYGIIMIYRDLYINCIYVFPIYPT